MSEVDKIEILKYFYEAKVSFDASPPTIPELAEKLDKSVSTVHDMLRELELAEMVAPPRVPGAPRDRRITSKGVEYLQVNGYIPPKLFEGQDATFYGDQISGQNDQGEAQ